MSIYTLKICSRNGNRLKDTEIKNIVHNLKIRYDFNTVLLNENSDHSIMNTDYPNLFFQIKNVNDDYYKHIIRCKISFLNASLSKNSKTYPLLLLVFINER